MKKVINLKFELILLNIRYKSFSSKFLITKPISLSHR